jgi:hypothetical protein
MHCWLRIPPLCDAFYVGPVANRVRVPSGVRPVNGGDVQILEFYFEDKNAKNEDREIERAEITVEEWVERIAEE